MSSARFTLDEARLAFAVPPHGVRETRTTTRRALDRYTDLIGLTDGIIVVAITVAAMVIRFGVPDAGPTVGEAERWLVATAIAAAWIVALTIYRTRDLRVVAAGSSEYRRVVSATAMVFGLAAIALFASDYPFSRSFFLIALPFGLLALLTSRRVFRSWIAVQRRHGRMSMSAVVVGPEADVHRVLTQLGPSTASAYRVVAAVLDDEPTRALRSGGVDLPVYLEIGDVASVVSESGADAVIVAGQPSGGGDYIRTLSWALERTSAELMIASRLANVAGPRIHFRPAEGLPLMHVEQPVYEGAKHIVKRMLDIALSAVALAVLAPIFLIIAWIVRIDSPGPALYSQSRIGRGGSSFRIWKFRSMVVDADARLAELAEHNQGNGVLFKLREDPRVTRAGRVLRRFSLDELPQLWNVLIGDMSLVGPRPPLSSEVQSYEDHVLRRLYIKPGLTGMWQVSGRSDLSWEDSVRLDLYYVENWSLAGDLQIMWRTAKVLLRPQGAY